LLFADRVQLVVVRSIPVLTGIAEALGDLGAPMPTDVSELCSKLFQVRVRHRQGCCKTRSRLLEDGGGDDDSAPMAGGCLL
jgi:hypothetical protein